MLFRSNMFLIFCIFVIAALAQIPAGLIGGVNTLPVGIGGNLTGIGFDLDALKAQIAALGSLPGVDQATIQNALGQIDMAKLQIKAADLQTAESIAMANAQIKVANGQLELASDLLLKTSITAKESFNLAAKLTIDASIAVKTQGLLLLKSAQAGLELSSKSLVTAAGLILTDSNKVSVALDAQLSVGLLQAQAGVSSIQGSIEVFSSHLLEVLKGAQLTLTAAAGSAATVEADIALRDASSQLTIANDVLLNAASKIEGAGAVIVQAKLDLQTKIAAQSSFEAGKLQLEAASQLLLKAQQQSATLLKIAGEAKFGGKLNIAADATVKEIILAHGSRVGTFTDVSINGEAAVASGGRKRGTSKWTVNYGATSTKITQSTGSSSTSSAVSSFATFIVAPIVALIVTVFVY